MTPLEIFDYKNMWMHNGGYRVRIHSDLDLDAKIWCRRNLEQYEWLMRTYSDIYEHTFWFEDQKVSQLFEQEFIDWVNK